MPCMDRYTHIYISPHLDDAVLSCGGRIWQQAQAGESVAVVTVFATAPEPGASLSPFAQELHARWDQPGVAALTAARERQAEDREAMSLLGVEAVHWRYKDCIYRRTPDGPYAYASEEALWGRIHPTEDDLIRELTGRMMALPLMPGRAAAVASLRAISPRHPGRAAPLTAISPSRRGGTLYVPLAVGRHVDHRIVRRAAEGCGRDLTYYEDFPYAEDSERVKAALGCWQWRAELVPLSPEALEAKIAAIARYRSQVSTFWDDKQDLAASVRAFAERTGEGVTAERYWYVSGP